MIVAHQSIPSYKLKKTKASLAVQDIALTIAAYSLFAGLTLQLVPVWFFLATIFLYTFRSFNIRHEKSHTSSATGLKPKWLDITSDFVQLFYLPYHEPYSGKRWKHLAHHRFHAAPEIKKKRDLKSDPHHIFEVGHFGRALITSFFYEEVNLYLDLKHRGLSRDRVIMALISFPIIGAMIYFGGWMNFLILSISYRVSLTIAWFTFSYMTHIPKVYGSRIGEYVPRSVLRALDFVLGHGTSTAVFYHSSHHTKPQEYVLYAAK
jgi:fatty acid desaturase